MTEPRPVPYGASAQITLRQDDDEHTRRLRAYSHLYRVGQRYRIIRAVGTAAFAAAPLVTWQLPGIADYVAAAAGAWLIVSRLLLGWAETRQVEAAVNVQELYDTELFLLPWNTAVSGEPPLPEVVTDAARKMKPDSRFDAWFRTDLDGVPWPADALLCQRESAVWSRADHRGYGLALLTVSAMLFLGTLAFGLLEDLTLVDYLIKLGLPISPALLDTVELGRTHLRFAGRRERLVRDMTDLVKEHRASLADVPASECRRVQDEAYRLRRDAPRVPKFYYDLRRNARHATTVEGNAELLGRPRA
ncbi:MAG TPA: S-4TM family putative pore-forming effector [Frankiaceae bacterium]|nr:S-4TM family putative pore-forming effector [Frankiaceae bacterium]